MFTNETTLSSSAKLIQPANKLALVHGFSCLSSCSTALYDWHSRGRSGEWVGLIQTRVPMYHRLL